MNEELIEQLEKAGFPFKSYGTGFDSKGNLERRPIVELSELIEACVGDGAMTLNITSDGCGAWWGTRQFRKTYAEGKTPKIALAKLWLEKQKIT